MPGTKLSFTGKEFVWGLGIHVKLNYAKALKKRKGTFKVVKHIDGTFLSEMLACLCIYFSLRGRFYYSENSLKKKKKQFLIKYRARGGNKEHFHKAPPS